jgi:aldehyde:ferredoxin oxidoreductase
MVVFTEALHRISNSFGVCEFNTAWRDLEFMSLPELAEMYSAATGWETSVEDLMHFAEIQLNLEKAFNLRHTNFDRTDDMLTQRDLNEPIPTGNFAGWKVDRAKWNQMLDEYYELHCWDKETSFPTKEKLEELGLENVASDLERIGKLR